jgi:predicted dehydrogenase
MAIRIGIIGTGMISGKLCDAIRRGEKFTAAAVLSRDRVRGEEFAAENGIPSVFTDEAAFLASDIDAVYVATPNRFHAAQAIAAARAGKHVLCEKPVALTTAEWDEMCAVAKENSVVLFEAIRPLHDPFFPILQEYLPRLGKLRHASLAYCQYSSRYDAFRHGEILRAFDPSYGNAAIMDIGIYVAAIAAALFGQPKSVTSHSTFLENGFEACGEATLSYEDITVSLTYSKVTQDVNPSIIYGEEGALTFTCPSAPKELWYHPRGGKPERLPHTPPANNMTCELDVFARLIETGEIDHPYLAISRTTMQIADAVRASSGIVF